jgi:hypothetical protein
MAMLAIGSITKYNTIAWMFLSYTLICFTALLIFHKYREDSSRDSHSKLLLNFLPISFLLFSFRQHESILLGFASHIYLMLFGAVTTFFLLERSKKVDKWFVSSLLSAFVSSFSFVSGLMAWPIGFLQMLISGQRDVRRIGLWCSGGIITFASYFYGYVKPAHHPPLNYVLANPLEGARYFLIVIGAPFSWDAGTAMAFGLVIMLIGSPTMVFALKEGILRRNGIWFSLTLFALSSSLLTTIGRAGFGAGQALSSRYTPITSLGIIGLYLLALRISEKSPHKHKSFGAYAMLTLILVGSIVSYHIGWGIGVSEKRFKDVGAYVSVTYKIQSDENIRKYLYPAPAIVRERARFLEENGLSVFSKPRVNLSALSPIGPDALFWIDTINGKAIAQQPSPIAINASREETITICGWAVDKGANDSALAVFATIDGKLDIPALYGLDRPDVAKAFDNPKFRHSGFMATFSSRILGRGEHALGLKIVARDGRGYYRPEGTVRFAIE